MFSIVFGLMVGIGLVLCIIPGLFVLAFFGMAPFFFIDRGMSLGDALSASREAASSRGFALPVILSIIVGVAGVIACGIGALVTAPAAYIAVALPLPRGGPTRSPAVSSVPWPATAACSARSSPGASRRTSCSTSPT